MPKKGYKQTTTHKDRIRKSILKYNQEHLVSISVRLCDNSDCWNLVYLLPWQLRSCKHYFCDKNCWTDWLRDGNASSLCAKLSSNKERSAKISANNGMKNPVNRARHKAAMNRSDVKTKISNNNGMKRPEVVAKVSGDFSVSKRPERRAEQSKFMKDHNPMKNPMIVAKCKESNIGHEVTDATRIKMSISQKGLHVGIRNGNWKDGASFKPYCPEFNPARREKVREDFGYKCAICDKPQSENLTKTGKPWKLSVHHIYSDKQEGCDGKDFFLAPLCLECHGKTIVHREYWEEELVDRLYACKFRVILLLD
jgi:nitrate/TMAO reductase-like tetraheme cytochrome c subunit